MVKYSFTFLGAKTGNVQLQRTLLHRAGTKAGLYLLSEILGLKSRPSPTAVLLESTVFFSLGLYLSVEVEMILHTYILKATILIGLPVHTAICWLFQLSNIPQC